MKKPNNLGHLLAAILISPIVGAFLGTLLTDVGLLFIIDPKSWLHNMPVLLQSNAVTSLFGIVFSLPVVLLYGVPVFFFLGKVKVQNIWMFGLFGLLPASIGATISWINHDPVSGQFYLHSFFSGALRGLFVACTFWFIAVYLPARSTR